MMEKLEKYLSPEQISILLMMNPKVLRLETNDIIAIIGILEKYNLKPSTISTVMSSNPKFLTSFYYDIDDMLSFLNCYSEDLDNLLESYPEIFTFTKEDLEEFISNQKDSTFDIEVLVKNLICDDC